MQTVATLALVACAALLFAYFAREPARSAPTSVPARSAPASATADAVIAAVGDIACDPTDGSFNGGLGTATRCRQKYTSDLLLDTALFPTLDALLVLGDAQYEDGAYAKFAQSYDPSFGRVKGVTRPAPGNHEYATPNAAGYFQYFGQAAGDPAKGYYSFGLGGWHLIALNSNCAQVGGCGKNSRQTRWLRNDLAAHPASCTLAYWHHPRFSSGPHGSDSTFKPFWQALYSANADVVLVGHDHDYERFAPQDANGARDSARGLRQFVVGTGGKTLYSFSSPVANSEVRASVFGVLKLTLRAGAYDWRFIAEGAETFTDSGSAACH